MLHENEFALLRETFKKCRLRVNCVAPDSAVVDVMDEVIRPFFAHRLSRDASFQEVMGEIKPQTLYRLRDRMDFSYIIFSMVVADENRCVIIGPYLDKPLNLEEILEISERNGFPPQHQKLINEFFATVPVVPENSALFLLLDAFCERMWQGKYEITEVENSPQILEQVEVISGGEKEIDDTFLDMKNMERRYTFENEMMNAVTMGFEHKVNQILSPFAETAFEQRLTDSLRNSKNYGIIMNTLLRKAAEQGGVHPIYLDRLSSRFAKQIEMLSKTEQMRNLMTDMFRAYCKLVRKHSAKSYSPVVKRAVIAIEADPSVEMNLHILAEKLQVSNGYLSSVFKKETGKTVTQYIHEKRLSYAEYLLKSTNLQIQTVALHCGMVDVQYFSRLFKRQTGKTPSQFREDLKLAD